MANLRIAFCGPNIAINENLAQQTYDLLHEDGDGLEIIPIGNPLLQLRQITRKTEWDKVEIDNMNLWAAVLRRMSLESVRDRAVLVTASCGIDQVAIQATWLAEQVEHQSSGIIGPNGKPIVSTDALMQQNRSGGVLQAIMNSTEQEVVEVYDFTYAMLPAIAPEADPNFASLLIQYNDFLTTVPAFKDSVTRLPNTEEAAKAVLQSEAEKWRKVLSS